MDISAIREAIQALYEAQTKMTAGTAGGEKQASFADCIKGAVKKENTVFPDGEDVVMNHPPLYATQYEVDMEKPKEEMTMEEYKKYICNVVSALPVSAGKKAVGSGALIFKEEALESMKNDSAYEKEVVSMLRETYSAEVSPYVPNVSYQVIGASKEECYGSAIPVKNYGRMMAGLNASGLGLTVPGISSLGLTGLSKWNNGWGSGVSSYGNSYANMVNAYKKTAESRNGSTGLREYKSRWR